MWNGCISPRHLHLLVLHYASVGGATEAYCNRFVCHSFIQSVYLHDFCGARWKLSSETCNASRTRYYLACEYVKFVYEASFSSYGVVCVLVYSCWRSGLLQRQRLSTVDCLEADRLLQDSSAGPEKLFKQAMEAISLVFSMHGRYWTL